MSESLACQFASVEIVILVLDEPIMSLIICGTQSTLL